MFSDAHTGWAVGDYGTILATRWSGAGACGGGGSAHPLAIGNFVYSFSRDGTPLAAERIEIFARIERREGHAGKDRASLAVRPVGIPAPREPVPANHASFSWRAGDGRDGQPFRNHRPTSQRRSIRPRRSKP
jgi:hypothetical protein